MKMMVPTLAVKDVNRSEYVTHWRVVIEHAHALCQRLHNADAIIAELNLHYMAILHQLNSVRDGFVSTQHADLIEKCAQQETDRMQEVLAMAHEKGSFEQPMDALQEADRIATGPDGVTIKIGGTGTKAELMEAMKRDPMDNTDVKRVVDQIEAAGNKQEL